MLNTYIKNSGMTQSFVHNNNKNNFSEMNWESDYDGNIANILVNSNNNGRRRQYNISLNNNDLANLLNVPSVSTPIDRRLRMDFQTPHFQTPQMIGYNPKELMINLPHSDEYSASSFDSSSSYPLESLKSGPKNYLTSPMPNEEFIVPVTIGKKITNNLRSKKSVKTYPVFKKKKSNRSKSSKRSSTRRGSKTSRKSKRKSSL